jgi:hypothetical protein
VTVNRRGTGTRRARVRGGVARTRRHGASEEREMSDHQRGPKATQGKGKRGHGPDRDARRQRGPEKPAAEADETYEGTLAAGAPEPAPAPPGETIERQADPRDLGRRTGGGSG